MRNTFRDPELQRRFAEDGFVRVRLLSEEEAAELRGTWERIQPGLGPGFHASLLSEDEDYRLAARRASMVALDPPVRGLLDNHLTFGGNLLAKIPGPESELGVHQDRTTVDESRFAGVAVWCALTDVDVANGALHLVPGSHRWAYFPRSESPGWPRPLTPFMDVLRDRASVSQPMRAGEALIFNPRTIHWSPPNTTAEPRPVAICGAVPTEAEMLHLQLADDGMVDVFRVDDPEFFDSYLPGTAVTGLERIARFELHVPELDIADLDPGLASQAEPDGTPDPPTVLRRIGWKLPHPVRHAARLAWDRAHRLRGGREVGG